MMARYEKDDEIERALTMIYKDEYKDDGFFNDDGTFEFAKCLECGGPKIGHMKRLQKKCCYKEEFLKESSRKEEDVEEMENKIRKMKGFKDAVMMLDKRSRHIECEIKDCDDRKQKSAYDLKEHLVLKHNCEAKQIKERFTYKKVQDNDGNDSDDEIFEKPNDQLLKQVLE